jgi:hypothetical protein
MSEFSFLHFIRYNFLYGKPFCKQVINIYIRVPYEAGNQYEENKINVRVCVISKTYNINNNNEDDL